MSPRLKRCPTKTIFVFFGDVLVLLFAVAHAVVTMFLPKHDTLARLRLDPTKTLKCQTYGHIR